MGTQMTRIRTDFLLLRKAAKCKGEKNATQARLLCFF